MEAKTFALGQNFPNPFNPSTTIQFGLPKRSYVTLKVYDVLGNEIATLIGHEVGPGHFTVQWQANTVSSGVYYYRLQAGDFVETKQMILLR